MRETAETFLYSRTDWLDVRLQETADGDWDVVLRLDGSYMEMADAAVVAALFRQRLVNLHLIPIKPVIVEDLTK